MRHAGCMTAERHRTEPDRLISGDDLAVTLAVREDLGPGGDPAVIAEFLDRVGSAIDQRVDERVAAMKQQRQGGGGPPIAFFSLIFGIPITAIAGGQEGVAGIAIAWAGIAAVNIAHALRS